MSVSGFLGLGFLTQSCCLFQMLFLDNLGYRCQMCFHQIRGTFVFILQFSFGSEKVTLAMSFVVMRSGNALEVRNSGGYNTTTLLTLAQARFVPLVLASVISPRFDNSLDIIWLHWKFALTLNKKSVLTHCTTFNGI